MDTNLERQKKLAYVARRYYLEDRKQSDIAQELGVSRPLVSRMLSEAREQGIVEITIHEPGVRESRLLERLRLSSSIRGGVLVEEGAGNDGTNRLLSRGAVELLRQLGVRRLGVGWGYLIGQLVSWLEENPQLSSTITDICPLVGNASIPARNYQSNENVRLMAQQMGAAPHFLYLPALPDSLEEKQLLCSTEVYRQIHQQWEQLDTALVNIGDYPSSPDFASLVRYGSLLQQQRACGRMLIYYFNEDGFVIPSEQDFAIQIPIDLLKRCPNIIGVCSANTSDKALRGALKSGFFTHIVARAELIKILLEK
ncbi:sugar-binding transcriptional regulator [uncultured Oscillibacter sp.]|uniref:sugar-binding transcriptional regulator n=1 Tax=uncultured Oscillibacter sp. TaxID=876091 RepID=UPI00261DAD2C|nr:sugar-binding domain-containing protein [uncultured Oscillibacter sp.]